MRATTPAEREPKGSAAPARLSFSERTHSLIDLELEREPSLDQLLRERDPGFYTPLTEMLERQVRRLVDERR